jgi:Subtilisin inhibitor-like
VRGLAVIALLLLGSGAACSGSGEARDVTIQLQITVWPEGSAAGKPAQRFRLSCNPLGGNLPHGDRACYRLATTARPFAPTPRGTGCAQVYGGPQVARVRGRLRGRGVDATFRRTDACESARWERVSFLFPVRLTG